jgi:hypothetical protein
MPLTDAARPGEAKRDVKLAQRIALDTSFEAVGRAWFKHWKGPKSPRHVRPVLVGDCRCSVGAVLSSD